MCDNSLNKTKRELEKSLKSLKGYQRFHQELLKEFCKYEVSKKRLRRPNRPKFKRPNPLEVAEIIRWYKVQ